MPCNGVLTQDQRIQAVQQIDRFLNEQKEARAALNQASSTLASVRTDRPFTAEMLAVLENSLSTPALHSLDHNLLDLDATRGDLATRTIGEAECVLRFTRDRIAEGITNA